ncbi:MAG: hypothetical protein MAG581_01049 [Deltaproteobacteria bacterium]|jgi:lipopolysaccharide export LptBFGC system permease protein LptF|nr:hypothetical protein [Deltaproteobacteria bacterium]
MIHPNPSFWSRRINFGKKPFSRVLQYTILLSAIQFPGVAYSCAVCFSGTEETLQAYYLTTVFLTLLPVLLLASIGYWLYRKHRES